MGLAALTNEVEEVRKMNSWIGPSLHGLMGGIDTTDRLNRTKNYTRMRE